MTTQHRLPGRTGPTAKPAFLQRLRRPQAPGYKRYAKLPLRYAGGKSRAVGQIIQHFPENLTSLVSPFLGGGAVEVANAIELDIPVQAYDVFDLLTNYWQAQLNQPEALADRITRLGPPTTDNYAAVKERLKTHWGGEELIKDPTELAAHYWYNHNLSYGPGFLGWLSKIYQDPARVERLIDKVRNFRCPNRQADAGRFQETIPKPSRPTPETYSTATRPTTWKEIPRCSAASTRKGTSPFITRASTTNCSETCYIPAPADSCCPTMTAQPSGTGTRTTT